MSRISAESSWQRFLAWIRRRQGPGEAPKTEQVAAWEDEGGATAAPAAGSTVVPAPPADPTR